MMHLRYREVPTRRGGTSVGLVCAGITGFAAPVRRPNTGEVTMMLNSRQDVRPIGVLDSVGHREGVEVNGGLRTYLDAAANPTGGVAGQRAVCDGRRVAGVC